MGWIGWRPTRHRLIARAWKGLSLGSRNRSELELLTAKRRHDFFGAETHGVQDVSWARLPEAMLSMSCSGWIEST